MDYLWSPWRYKYIATGGKDEGCIFCRAAAANDDSRTHIIFRGIKNFIILNRYRNLVTTDLLDKAGLREWLIDALRERRRAYYW